MCGIGGLATRKDIVRDDVLLAMRDTMVHRGPDAAGIWKSPDGAVGLVHRRLSIIDLSSDGNQPMVDETGKTVIVFNGEIYNYKELRVELEQRGHRFRSKSDTEVLLEGYKAWGEGLLSRLNGMFAFALYDGNARKLFLARDRAGEKPLFYAGRAGSFAFASELKSLMADPSLPRRIRPSSLESYLTYGYVPGDECILEGVNKLPPGHAMVCSLDTLAIRVWSYWQLPEPQLTKGTLEDCARELEGLLCDSVRRQLVADVPIGVLLSGGVDSSLVTAAAAKVSSGPIHTFTVRFPDHQDFDEGKYAEIVAKHFGTRHTELVAEPASLELLPILAAQYDEPMCDSSMIPTYLVSRMIRKSATVALGGDGGDELFGGYRSYNVFFQQRRLASMLPSPMRRLLATVSSRLMPVGTPGRNYIASIAGSLPERVARASRHHDLVSRRRLVPALNARIPYRAPTPEAFKEALFQAERGLPGAAMAVDFGSYLPEDILVKVDRASMLASLETRSPFLDYRIIEFAFARIPNEWRANAVDRKIVLRKLCASMLPASLDINRKQGFSLPLGDWFRGAWGTYAREVLLDSSASVFDHDSVRDLLNGLMRGRTNSERIFGLLLFELWRRKYNAVLC